ncbi:MAG: hypothetical protein IT371_25055 [Deltaproteobacteria bacterium]|nr:hypothetical protein [Deltaproteobacteria bacterium]
MLTTAQMAAAFQPDPTLAYRALVGFEYEVLCVSRRDLAPLRYEGPAGVRAILEEVARRTGGALGGDPPANKVPLPDGGLISVEPGGQLEFSSAPVPTFGECMEQLRSFLALLDGLAERFDLHFFYGGVNPVHTVDEIGLVVANPRYRIMDAYFPRVGRHGRRMMRQSCSLQVTFDYQNAALGTDLVRSAAYLAPIAAGILANAPYVDGQPTAYRSFRAAIWGDTDSSRSGLLPGFTRPDYGFEDYVKHVVRAPMFFVARPEGLVDAAGMTFETFNREGFDGRFPTEEDFLLHNSTIFTDIRLKRTVEVRSVDCQDPALVPSVLALLSGLLLCKTARARTREVLGGLDEAAYASLSDRLGREGLSGTTGARPTRDVALDLVQAAREGLPTCFPDGAAADVHLDRLEALIRAGDTPADVVRRRFGDDARGWLAAGRTFSDEGSLSL